MRSFLLSCSALFLLSSCASIVSGKKQEIALDTTPPGANCNLTRDGQFLAGVPQTPGKVEVEKTKEDIEVVCHKPQFMETKEHLNSGTDDWVFGNIFLGGLIGWGVDSAVGADNKYPTEVALSMTPAPAQQSQQVPFGYSSMAPSAGGAPAGWIVGPPGIPQSNISRTVPPTAAIAPAPAYAPPAPAAVPPKPPVATH